MYTFFKFNVINVMKNKNRCETKRRFNNEIEARKERLYIEKEYNKKFRIYNCSDCNGCLLYTSPSPRDNTTSRMPSSA